MREGGREGGVNMPSLQRQREVSCVCLLHKIIHGYVHFCANATSSEFTTSNEVHSESEYQIFKCTGLMLSDMDNPYSTLMHRH